MSTKVEDPDPDSPEFCLDCYFKHSGHANILIAEALDRVRQDPKHADHNTVAFIRLHAGKAFDELTAAENHVKYAKTDDPVVKAKLDKLAHDARITRDKIRRYLKTAPNPQSINWNEMQTKIASGQIIPRTDYLIDAQNDTKILREVTDQLIAEIGCGDCMASEEDMKIVKNKIAEMEKNFLNPIPNLKPVPQSIPHLGPPSINNRPINNPWNKDKDPKRSSDSLIDKQIIEPMSKEIIKMRDEIFDAPRLLLEDLGAIFTSEGDEDL